MLLSLLMRCSQKRGLLQAPFLHHPLPITAGGNLSPLLVITYYCRWEPFLPFVMYIYGAELQLSNETPHLNIKVHDIMHSTIAPSLFLEEVRFQGADVCGDSAQFIYICSGINVSLVLSNQASIRSSFLPF